MDPQQPTIVVIPCYDEELRLPSELLLSALERWPWLTLVLVDDGSRDGTRALLERLASRRPGQIRTVLLEHNVGKGEAVRQGVLAALAGPRPWAFGYWDADLATPLEELPRMCQALEQEGVLATLGSRVQMLGHHIERDASRHYLGRVYATVVNLLVGLRVYDTQCGAKLFRASDLTETLFAEPFTTRWSFDVELLLRLQQRARVAELGGLDAICREVPLQNWRDVAGSKLSLSSAPRILRELGTIGALGYRARRRKRQASGAGTASPDPWHPAQPTRPPRPRR